MSEIETWVNGLRFVVQDSDGFLTGDEIRYLPTPPITDEYDLFLQGQRGGMDMHISKTETIQVDGREFFSVPQTINAG
jgi:hypothetical protein